MAAGGRNIVPDWCSLPEGVTVVDRAAASFPDDPRLGWCPRNDSRRSIPSDGSERREDATSKALLFFNGDTDGTVRFEAGRKDAEWSRGHAPRFGNRSVVRSELDMGERGGNPDEVGNLGSLRQCLLGWILR